MTSSVRSWDLASGAPAPMHGKERAAELIVCQSLDPFKVPPEELGGPDLTKTTHFDVWGFDPRVTVLVQHFYRRARWFNLEIGNYSEEEQAAASVPGTGMSFACKVFPLAIDVEGTEHTLGQLDGSIWLGDGLGQGGCEISSACLGLRFEYEVTMPFEAYAQGCSTWDIVANVVVKPNGRIGCGEAVEEIVNGLCLTKPRTPLAFLANWGGL